MTKRILSLFILVTSFIFGQNIQWQQLATGSRHGTQTKGQSSDGTGTSGNLPKYNADGSLTDSGISSVGLTIPSNCALVSSNSTPALNCQNASGLSSVAYVAGGGTANAQTAVYAPAITSLASIQGYPICWLPIAANSTTTPTLAVNGLFATTIVKQGGAALANNDLTSTAVACAIYDGTNFELQNPQTLSSGGVSSVTATAPLTSSGGTTPNISATYQGNGAKIQASTGTTTTNDCVKFDANGNTVDSGAACGTGSGGAMTQLAQVTGPASPTLSFTSISGSYNQLRLYCIGGTNKSGVSDNINMQFNSDTAADYANIFLFSTGTVSSGQNNSQTSTAAGTLAGASAQASDAGILIIDIPGYASIAWRKQYTVLTEGPAASPGVNGRYLSYNAGFWSGTAAITRIDLITSSGSNWASSTVCTLYGIN